MTDEDFYEDQTTATMQSANEAAKRAEEAREQAEQLKQQRGQS